MGKQSERAPATESDRRFMAAALRIGARNLGQTGRNPSVGCVLVDTSGSEPIVIGRGVTASGGRPHAERQALIAAGEAARGATAYVTLEPCAHTGTTESCAQSLISAGVARVVTGMEDPDPRTSGQGHSALAAAGIPVTTNVLAAEAARAHSGHVMRLTHGRPHVTLKLAVSADGMIGTRDGERMIITGKPAFDTVQTLRTRYDVIMVGIGTVLVDDPQLNVRLPGLSGRSSTRVILDAQARIPLQSRLLATARDLPLIIMVGADAPPDRIKALVDYGAQVVETPSASDGLVLLNVLEALAEQGFSRVFAEGGAKVAATLVNRDLLDEAIIFRAPVVVGPDGVRALDGMAMSAIERSPRYKQILASMVGEDQMRTYVRAS
jgi:diaminohydroxyphosphoribosylaminopyrimidine deaminase/5-amino-6-(5-phosphoribosylamino)uracil reductase